MYIDRIYDTLIDEEELQTCDNTIKNLAEGLEKRPYSAKEFIKEMGHYLINNAKKQDSLVQTVHEKNAPIFCPVFSNSSAGFGPVKHHNEHISIDSVKDFIELTQIKIESDSPELFMIGGGVPTNFTQDTVICAEILDKAADIHKYVVQITVADVRDGACSSSTLREASSRGKVDTSYEQMVYAEATSILPLIMSYVYYKGSWSARRPRQWSKIFDTQHVAK